MKRVSHRILLLQILFLCATLFPVAIEGQVSQRRRSVNGVDGRARAPFAFHYAPSLTAEALAWYSQFDILVTHDPIPRDQVEQLHAAGTKVLLYEWSVAFYESRATTWQRSLLSNHEDLLNASPLRGWAGSSDEGAWYFDPASPEHEFGRTEDIIRRLNDAGYDGVFFDTTRLASVHPDARREYEARHPHISYDFSFSHFLAQLRRQLPNVILFTNQAYRSAFYYLPYVDWDLTESLITWPGKGSFQLRPWHDEADLWNSTHFLMRRLIEPIAAMYPNVQFAHLNYVNGYSPETIHVVVAAAQLFGGDGYVAAPALGGEVDPIYFRTPGKPVAARVDLPDRKAAWRFFENGLIVVTSAEKEITIPNTIGKGLRNHVTGELACGNAITLPPATSGPRAYFLDYTSDCAR